MKTVKWDLHFLGGPLLMIMIIIAERFLSLSGVDIPNPFILSFIPVIYASFVGGLRWGLITSMIVVVYGIFSFSDPNRLFSYSGSDFLKLCLDSTLLFLTALIMDKLKKAVKQHYSKAYREALNKSQEDYRFLIENQTELVVRADNQGKLLYVSPSYCRMFGMEDEDLVGSAYLPLIHPEDQEITAKAMENLYVPPYTCYVEQRVKAKDGWRWIAWADKAILDSEGRLKEIIGVGRDVTELREARQAVEENERFLQNIFNSFQDGISVVDKDLNVLRVNPVTERRFPSAAAPGAEKCYERYRGSRSRCPNCPTTRAIQTGTRQMEIRQTPDPQGGYFWREVQTHPMMDEKGKIIGAIEYTRDITLAKRTEDEIRKSNAILRAQQEAVKDGILVLDQDEKVVSFNRAFLDICQLPHSTVNGSHLRDIWSLIRSKVKDREFFLSMAEYLNLHSQMSNRDEIRLMDGRTLEWYSAPVFLDEDVLYGRIWCFRDITEYKKSLEALRVKNEENSRLLNEVVEYDRLKTEFFSTISHELRTPLNVILGVLQLFDLYFKQGDLESNPERIPKYSGIMKQNCYRLLRLVTNLIDITRIDSGFFELHPKNCDIVHVIKGITLSVAEYTEKQGLTLSFNSDIMERKMACDPEKIERIMLNLLSNAVKFTPEGGKISVQVNDGDDHIFIAVRDSGIGIPKEKQGIIFDRFRQANSSLTREREGSGIGLSLVKSLVEMHQGSIEVQSVMGEGTVFLIRLPVCLLEEGQTVAVHSSGGHNRIERIHIEFSDIYS